MTSYELRPIGRVESPLAERERAPKQGFEGSPDAWLVFAPSRRRWPTHCATWPLAITPILDIKPVLAGGR